MIIVKTSNGDVFINEKAAILVENDHEAKKVHVQTAENYVNPIENVEMVIYTSDAQPTQWEDEGSVIQKLRAAIERLKEEIDYTRSLMRYDRQAFMAADSIIDLVRYELRLKEDARSWTEIEDRINDMDKRLETIKTERDKVFNDHEEKRLAPCRGE